MGPAQQRARELRILQEMERCVHFNGVQHGTCLAGVVYKSVQRHGPMKFPCLSTDGDCARRELPTREQAEAIEKERESRIAAFLQRTRLGICECGSEATDWEQSGPCIYSIPCGHRVGQGNAKQYKAGVLKARAERSEPATTEGKAE